MSDFWNGVCVGLIAGMVIGPAATLLLAAVITEWLWPCAEDEWNFAFPREGSAGGEGMVEVPASTAPVSSTAGAPRGVAP